MRGTVSFSRDPILDRVRGRLNKIKAVLHSGEKTASTFQIFASKDLVSSERIPFGLLQDLKLQLKRDSRVLSFDFDAKN